MIKSFDSNEFKLTQKVELVQNEIKKEDQTINLLKSLEPEIRPFKVLEVKTQDLQGYTL